MQPWPTVHANDLRCALHPRAHIDAHAPGCHGCILLPLSGLHPLRLNLSLVNCLNKTHNQLLSCSGCPACWPINSHRRCTRLAAPVDTRSASLTCRPGQPPPALPHAFVEPRKHLCATNPRRRACPWRHQSAAAVTRRRHVGRAACWVTVPNRVQAPKLAANALGTIPRSVPASQAPAAGPPPLQTRLFAPRSTVLHHVRRRPRSACPAPAGAAG